MIPTKKDSMMLGTAGSIMSEELRVGDEVLPVWKCDLISTAVADNYFRHLYNKDPNFKQLAKQDADFAAVVQENGQLDFTDPAAVMQLTKTLLKADFGLQLQLPDDRLCPPIPNRHNYILWLKDLLDSTSYSPPGSQPVCGLDIGTGASCIYPLLGTIQRPSWHFIATDIDDKSLEHAKQNVEMNNLSDRIRLILRSPEDTLIPSGSESHVSPLAFVMMNPPFYTSVDEMLSSAAKKSRPPHSACTGAPVEMVCEGGEVAHVGRLLKESLVLRGKGAQWYTSMLGKVTSLEALVPQLRENGIDNYAVTEFIQGNKTKRWAIAWSFGPMRPAERVARNVSGVWKKLLPPILRMDLGSLPAGKEVGPMVDRIREVIGGLELISTSQFPNMQLSFVTTSILLSPQFIPKMSDQSSRFTPQNKTTHERLSTNTVGLVALSDFRKRRAEVLEQQEREAREAATAAATPPDRSQTSTPNPASDANSKADTQKPANKKKKITAATAKRPGKKALVSFGGDEEEKEEGEPLLSIKPSKSQKQKEGTPDNTKSESEDATATAKKKIVNPSATVIPRALTKSALRKEAAEKEALRKEFLAIQAAVKATEIAIPFVFYDGTNTPGGIVRVKKGDHVWLFLDKSRKVGAELGVGSEKSSNVRRDWARVSVDDLLLVRGSIIIPHHYEFYYFIINQTVGPGNKLLFNYSTEAPKSAITSADAAPEEEPATPVVTPGLSQPKKGGNNNIAGGVRVLTDISLLEGWRDDPTFTKVVDRRWYQRNKHIYPASTWQDFDPEKDYQSEIKRDTGGNAFFFSSK
ncbi:hypothetical protein QBC38DRAFT_509680 [Podospora fimiseda]|uniref:FAM50A/XAP5 C-terminal domain-containing protein n=1 Tax=Podospora fimiseda TaxID=252190 RepID=A0AAN7GUR2_9PEZI|nr:hypothetical protein QBC38DRAFT_509680 [Podospora fimiseda]